MIDAIPQELDTKISVSFCIIMLVSSHKNNFSMRYATV